MPEDLEREWQRVGSVWVYVAPEGRMDELSVHMRCEWEQLPAGDRAALEALCDRVLGPGWQPSLPVKKHKNLPNGMVGYLVLAGYWGVVIGAGDEESNSRSSVD
jgi:hypothetical protein